MSPVFGRFCGILFLSVSLCLGEPDRDYKILRKNVAEWMVDSSPEFSTIIGRYKYNDQLKSLSVDVFDVLNNKTEYFMERLDSISRSSLSEDLQSDYDILRNVLQTVLDGYQWRFYTNLNPINLMEGPQTYPGGLAYYTPFNTIGDFENYIARLEKLPKQNNEIVDRMKLAVKLGRALHNVSMILVPGQFSLMLNTTAEEFPLFSVMNRSLDKTNLDESVKASIRSRVLLATERVMDSYRDMLSYIETNYTQQLRQGVGVMHWENGKELYKAMLKWHISVDMTPEQVHQIGWDEVHRIYSNMAEAVERIGYNGTPKEFYDSLKGNPEYYTTNTTVVLETYRDIVLNQIPPKLSNLFNDIPEAEVRVLPTPVDGGIAYYRSASADGLSPGTFYINLFRPDEISLNDYMAISLHEASPGHHFQLTIESGLDIPAYRHGGGGNYYNVPFWYPFNTAYTEGWGLYAEYLGEELGLYTNDYILMGRYNTEMLRACRLVVDTGMHYFNWTRDDAIEHMVNYTSWGREAIVNQVDRYATLPGQACAYKIGEIKIKELRRKSERELGEKFNIKDFHTEILRHGSLPLNVLETFVNKWIASEKAKDTDETDDNRCPVNPSSGPGIKSNVILVLTIMSLCVLKTLPDY